MHAISKRLGLALLIPGFVTATPMGDLLAKRDASTYKLDTDYSSIHSDIFPITYTYAPGYGDYTDFLDAYYDDEGWWGNAWLDVYDLTANETYLEAAITIYNDVVDGEGTPCGGIWWDKANTYVAAISNGLYAELSAGLANRVSSDEASTYLASAEAEWDWFFSSGLIDSDNIVYDGLGSDGCTPSTDIFTYNQGVILGAAAELYKATGNDTYLTQAAALADASTADGSPVTSSSGILTESCDTSQSCDTTSEMFKGAYIRGLRKLQLVDPETDWLNYITRNAQSLWNNDLDVESVDGNSECVVGSAWAGPFDASQANAITQGSALDALNSALAATT
ncbi:hypothetical protein UA08_08831 [Talaromyces atroroseus]|uniref:Mannan endo-1,6-alpha-mannosidase n=1 Tax=Talaromyces atroroseus TaxID=1441469 RepID=A0A225AD16_TALAT|nr:hypothetical protein UA08_08831 [Talaromyces atroroseus]OKL55804.1 hypothetical protein UA08_08831 [Talaromyces atroroseus]